MSSGRVPRAAVRISCASRCEPPRRATRALRAVVLCAAVLCALTLGASGAARAQEGSPAAGSVSGASEGRSLGWALLFYLPNRVFDLVDPLRVRIRVGPGVALRTRVTELLDAGVGSYTALYAGFPGARQRVAIPYPIGVETYSGAELGPVESGVAGSASPNYASTEVGASLHAIVFGLDLGVDPFELVDWLAGLAFLDLRSDDF